MNDILPGATATWRLLESVVIDVIESYGYREIRLPILEQTELFARSIGEATDVVEKEMYTFTDRDGDRIERAALGISGYMLEECGVYDHLLGADELRKFVQERDPKTIGVNISDQIGAADGLSHSGYEFLQTELGETYASRLTSAEKLVSDFRSRRVASEIVAFGEAA